MIGNDSKAYASGLSSDMREGSLGKGCDSLFSDFASRRLLVLILSFFLWVVLFLMPVCRVLFVG